MRKKIYLDLSARPRRLRRSSVARRCLAKLIPFLLTGDLINTAPRERGPIQYKRTPPGWLPPLPPPPPPLPPFRVAELFEGLLERPESFLSFCDNFYSARNRERNARARAQEGIADPPGKMDHENVTIHLPLGNYVIKMIPGRDGVMNDRYERRAPIPRVFTECPVKIGMMYNCSCRRGGDSCFLLYACVTHAESKGRPRVSHLLCVCVCVPS